MSGNVLLIVYVTDVVLPSGGRGQNATRLSMLVYQRTRTRAQSQTLGAFLMMMDRIVSLASKAVDTVRLTLSFPQARTMWVRR